MEILAREHSIGGSIQLVIRSYMMALKNKDKAACYLENINAKSKSIWAENLDRSLLKADQPIKNSSFQKSEN